MRGKRNIILFLFILIFTELIGFRLWAAEEIGGARITGGFTVLSLFISAVVSTVSGSLLSGVLKKYKYKPENKQFYQCRCLNKIFFLLWAALFICYIPCFLAFYPGIYNNDMVWQWAMYAMKHYNSHHPILHTYFAGSIFELGKNLFGSYNAGLAIHSILQLVLVSGSLAFALRYMLKTGSSKKAFLISAFFYALYPYIPVMGLSTTKDTIFSCLFLLLFLLICDMVQENQLCSGIKLPVFLSIMALCGMFRNNASYGFILVSFCLFLWSLFLKLRKRDEGILCRLALLMLVGVVLSQIGLGLLAKTFQADKGKLNEMLSVPCQQLARTYKYHKNELSEEEKEVLFAFIPEESLESYVYYISDPVKNELKEELLKAAPMEFVKLWIKIGLRYPKEYAEAFLTNTFGVWYLTGDTGSNIPYGCNVFFDSRHVFTEESKLPGLKSFYKWFHYKNYETYLPVVSMVFYTPFFNWLVVFAFFAVIDKKRFHLLVLPLFLLCYIFTVLLGPCVAVRYLFNIILCVPALLSVILKPLYRSETAGQRASCQEKMT